MRRVLTAALVATAMSVPAAAAEDPLSPLGFLVGSCWKGEFPGSTGVTDTHCFEPVYGGRFVRDRHVVEGAGQPYLGESLYRWDAAARVIRYTYDSSDGGHSDGTMRPVEGGLSFDDSYLAADGTPLKMRVTWTREGADGYVALAESMVDGAWKTKWRVPFHRVPAEGRVDAQFPGVRDSSYREADGSGVIRLSSTVRAPAAKIWTALTTSEGWERWGVKRAWIDFRLGGVIETSYNEAATRGLRANIKNRIEAIVPGRMLTIRNVQAPPDFAHAEEFAQTVTTLLLTPQADGSTEVSLTAVGYRPGPAFDALYEMFRGGDAWTLQNLKTEMEKPAG